VSETNYTSGDDFVVEFLGYRFGFNAVDFEQRVNAAAVRLGLVEPGELDPDETADLVELTAHGVIAIAERADAMRVLPDDLALGRPGLVDRLDNANADWFASMREGLSESVPSADLPSMLAAAGLEVLGSRLDRKDLAPPLPEDARRVVRGVLQRSREQLGGRLDDEDLRALDVLVDPDDPRSVLRRPDVHLSASRWVVIARAPAGSSQS